MENVNSEYKSPHEKVQGIMDKVLVLDWLLHEPTKDKMIVREYPINMSSILGGMEGDTLNMLTGIPYLVLKTGPTVSEVKAGDIIDMSKSFWLEEYNESKGTRPNMMKISIASSGGWVIMVTEGNTSAIKDRINLNDYFDGKIYSANPTKEYLMQLGKFVFPTYNTTTSSFKMYQIPSTEDNLKSWIKNSNVSSLEEFMTVVEKQESIEVVHEGCTFDKLSDALKQSLLVNRTTFLY